MSSIETNELINFSHQHQIHIYSNKRIKNITIGYPYSVRIHTNNNSLMTNQL